MAKSRVIVILLLAIFVLSGFDTIFAATYTVDRTDDSALNAATLCTSAPNDCSLRGAIIRADINPGDDTIHIPGSTFTLTLAGSGEDAGLTGDLDIQGTNGAVTIIGAGAAGTTIRAGTDATNGIDRVFHILSGAQATISNVTIQYGNTTGDGGGIYNDGTLTLNSANIISNRAGNGATGQGGGILNSGSGILMVTDVTIAGNNADVHGGAICNFGFATIFGSTLSTNDAIGGDGGGILNDGGNLNITNSTITTNGAQNSGGGISNSGTANLTNVTVVSNGANTSGGNLYNSTGYTLTVRNTIIANSVTTTNCNGVITSASGNLSSDLSCGLPGSDLSNVDPLLGGLAGNGGPTLTHALLPGSPAIDAGNGGVLPTTDQRGYVRVWDGNGDGTAIVDIGAYEYGAPPYTTPSSIPTMNEWGMIIFMVLAGIGSFYYLRRQKTVKS